jgi:hypothetical protein
MRHAKYACTGTDTAIANGMDNCKRAVRRHILVYARKRSHRQRSVDTFKSETSRQKSTRAYFGMYKSASGDAKSVIRVVYTAENA